jgi:hypothetical protein
VCVVCSWWRIHVIAECKALHLWSAAAMLPYRASMACVLHSDVQLSALCYKGIIYWLLVCYFGLRARRQLATARGGRVSPETVPFCLCHCAWRARFARNRSVRFPAPSNRAGATPCTRNACWWHSIVGRSCFGCDSSNDCPLFLSLRISNMERTRGRV